MQKVPRAVTGDFDHATVGQQGSLHGKNFQILPANLEHRSISLKAWISGRVFQTLAEFKREKRRMTVVVMSSAQDASLAERVRAQDAAFLKKPFFPADIEAVLTRHYGLSVLNPKRA